MSRSRYAIPVRFTCAEPGCREVALYNSSNREDYQRLYRRQSERPFRCVRHAKPEEVLSPKAPERSHVLVATRLPHLPDHLFWIAEGATSGSRFTYGPGFKAFAGDVPEGTRLVVSARLELPEDAEP